jgi:hypothetical protein
MSWANASWSQAYINLSLGAMNKQLEGKSEDYRAHQSFAGEVSLGHSWQNWDLALDTSYSVGRQKETNITYNDNKMMDDFNWQSVNVGPTIKYHFTSETDIWSWAPFLGGYFNYSHFGNSGDLYDAQRNEHDEIDNEVYGYGGKLGVEFKKNLTSSNWLESLNYKLYASYTKYRKVEGNFQSGDRIAIYKGDMPDKLHQYAIGVMVGVRFGDKVYQKAKRVVGL